MTSWRGTGIQGRRSRPWSLVLRLGQSKREIIGEAIDVAFHLLVQPLHGHTVERGKVRIEDDSVAAQNQDRTLRAIERDKVLVSRE